MGHKFAEIAFTDSVKDVQSEQNSRAGYVNMEQGEGFNFLLSDQEKKFITQRDSFYMASVSETDWPYVQHRGGPQGFIKIIDQQTIGFADYSGNRQYVSAGNFRKNDRVAIIFMDYPNRRRLKLLGRVRVIEDSELETLARLESPEYRAVVERGFLIHVEAFDWNCPQHITPRYTDNDVQALLEPLQEENRILKQESDSNIPVNSSTPIGHGALELVVSGIRQLTPQVRSYELTSAQGNKLPEFGAGSHIQIPIRLDSGKVVYRHYSISSDPSNLATYEIAVRRDDKGTGGSMAVHQNMQLGLHLNCTLPENNFALHEDSRPAVLIAGGIGVTPIKAMASELGARGVDFEIHFAGRNVEEMPFHNVLQESYGDKYLIYSGAEENRLDINRLLSTVPPDSVIYTCGPIGLLDDVFSQAKIVGMDIERLRFERFVAAVGENAKAVVVNLKKSGTTVSVAKDQTILDAILDAGVDIPYSCKAGVCGSCATEVLGGKVDHFDGVLSEGDKTERKLMCPCVSRAKTESLDLML
ncbi:MAG: pyridoxamine 5'-phosphate oxidase [SAR86 cluster bacterium]|uniref:Pyridoxamine 5'-phosphate oxidase n=1 Tax=SAR86 cluster bacterium TaxID=2030880 RepID=A0A2A4X033_9GAMM|nr:MAG: pyridoxamine 5'-phosphate oxidase [SAR86 cluster bacterium]